MNPAPTGIGLPPADAVSQAHSDRVAGHLRKCIARAGGSISFAQYMHEVLYAPGLGYYAAGASKFGAAGDFVTAPEVSPLFGRILGRACASVLRDIDGGSILELGGGTGRLALDVLRHLVSSGVAFERYLLLEVSPDLRERQATYLRTHCADLMSRIAWVDRLPDRFRGVVLANEVADALPVERFVKRDGRTMQSRVSLERGNFTWGEQAAPPFLEEAVVAIERCLGCPLPDGYTSEVATGLSHWIEQIATCLERGLFLLVDYGLARREYYAPERATGWLRCHFRHHAHENPLILPGIQDLTAWVDFTAVAEAAADAGMDLAGFVTQAQFLLNGGLCEELSEFAALTTRAQMETAQQVKMLTLPGEMGENFKCIGLARGDLAIPAALSVGDRAHTL